MDVTLVPLDNSKGLSVCHDWGLGNQMVMFTRFNYDHSKKTNKTCHIENLVWQVSFYENEISRSLVSESCSVFKSIQRLSVGLDPLSRQELVKCSRKYRSVIHACYSNLISSDGQSNSDMNNSLSNMFYQIEIVWNLCEILYLDIHETGMLVSQLSTWIRWHFTECVTQADAVISVDMPHIHEWYWQVIISYILRGDIDNARRFLELHPEANTKEEFVMLNELLRKMPINSPHQLLHEFYLRWQSWHDECYRLYHDGFFQLTPNIELIVGILAGEAQFLPEMCQYFESWCQLLLAVLLFTDPCIKDNNLANLSVDCIDLFFKHSKKQQNRFDRLLVAAFSYELMQVIQESLICFDDNWWFAMHLIDLLYNANQLNDQHQIEMPHRLREFFIINYANSLMTHHSIWHFAMEYFDYCPERGFQYIETNLERIAIDSDLMAHKVINMAKKRNSLSLVNSVCKINSRRWLRKGKLGNALIWAIKSEDPTLNTHIADLYLQEYQKSGEFIEEDVLSNLGATMLISDRLTFLAKYYEFHYLKRECQLQAAAQLLTSLLSSRIAPKFFVPKLILDSLPLLETQGLVMSSKQTLQISSSLEEMLMCIQDMLENNKEESKSRFIECLNQQKDIIRLAISRNLARSYVFSDTN